MRKERFIRIGGTVLILAVLTALWGTESDLAYNIAQQRAVLLGRYTLEKTLLLLLLTPLLLIALCRVWKKKASIPTARRLAWFKGLSITLAVAAAVIFADIALRLSAKEQYIGTAQSYHRRPGQIHRGVFHDRPESAFSYPNALPGHPAVPFTLTVDRRGFRNPAEQETYDWIVLGDSFAEGSSVSDEHVWPALLAAEKKVRIYNLGMSGGSPVTYLDTLKTFGDELKPKKALYMLYEGNDLRDSNFRAAKLDDSKKPSLSDRIFKGSPLRRLFKDSVQRLLSPVGSDRFANDPSVNEPGHRLYPVAWLPAQIPAGGEYGYAFDVKRLEQHYITEEQFRQTRAFAEATRLLAEAADYCNEQGIELIFIYAPDTPHVMMDDILDRVPPEQLHAFMATRRSRLPDPAELCAALYEGVRVRERIFKEFCGELGIPFISLTEPLREKTRAGVRTYYTYDQHWTPDGHRAVADVLSAQIPAE